jgi:hypothetical protein
MLVSRGEALGRCLSEILDDGAEQRTVFLIEGELPGGRLLSPTRIPAERYPAMGWVTEAWGMAPVIFAGQGRRDHLRVAIQMLSGAVPRLDPSSRARPAR